MSSSVGSIILNIYIYGKQKSNIFQTTSQQSETELGHHLASLPLPSKNHGDFKNLLEGDIRWPDDVIGEETKKNIPSGKLTVCYWKWPFIVDLPIKNGDFP